MSKLPDSISSVDVSDAGDGSTSVSINFADGERWHANVDVPYDAAFIRIEQDGESFWGTKETVFEYDEDSDDPDTPVPAPPGKY